MHGARWFPALRIGGGRFFAGRLLLTLAFAIAALPLHARRDVFGQEPDEFPFDEKYVEKWKESEVALPSYPDDRDLLPVRLPPTDTLKIYVDRKSVSRAPDRVARFTLVVESPSGTRSVFYDGMRCETRQYKTYAIGTPERALTAVRNPPWQTIPRAERNAFRDQLYRHYVCDQHSSARTPEDLVRLLSQQP